MARKKNIRYKQLSSFNNVYEAEYNVDKGLKEVLKNKADEYGSVILELGCGKGEYTLYFAEKYADSLCIGMDIKGERLWKAAKLSDEKHLNNCIFIRSQIDHIIQSIPPHSVDAIWITFPDPFPRDSDSRKRLTSYKFLELYYSLLKDNGTITLKTDYKDLYEWTQLEWKASSIFDLFVESPDVYKEEDRVFDDAQSVQTTFEKKKAPNGEPIYYLVAKKN